MRYRRAAGEMKHAGAAGTAPTSGFMKSLLRAGRLKCHGLATRARALFVQQWRPGLLPRQKQRNP
jgi:hypothetical protein